MADDVVVPAFEEVGKYIESLGLAYSVVATPERVGARGVLEDPTVRLSVFKDKPGYNGDGKYPHLTVRADKLREEIFFVKSNMWPTKGGSGGGDGSCKTSEITKEMLQEKATRMILEALQK